MADRTFSIVQRRQLGASAPELSLMGTGVDHGDGTATVTPAAGLPGAGTPAKVKLDDLTEGFHGGTSTSLVYDHER